MSRAGIRRGRGGFWAGAMTLLVAALVAGSGLLVASRRTAREAESNLERKNRERQALAAQEPAPTADRAAAIEADLARAAAALQAVEGRLWRRDAPAPSPPASGTEAFFDLAGFIRTTGERAARAGVAVNDGEHFGFSAYRRGGPRPAVIPAVDRQRRAAATLLQTLIAARPQRIDQVQRENPDPGGAGAARAAGGDAAGSADYFAMEPRWSLRTAGAVETTAFRLVFTGDSQALRRLLNRLAEGDSPVVVRTVAAEPIADPPPRRPASTGGGRSLALLVRAARSRFSVTVECCDVTGPGAAKPPPPDGAGAAGRWPEPLAQARGSEWLYDLFTPPAIYYDSRGPALHAAATMSSGGADPSEAPDDLELLEVRRGPFRLQLIGYAERPGDVRGIFADAISGETVVARSGDRLRGQGVTIRRLALDRPGAVPDGETAGREPAAIATVAEDSTGGEIELTTRERCLAGAPIGLFSSRRATALRREAGAGESFVLDGISYCVEEIDLQPPQALVACTPRGGAGPPVRRFVRLRAADPAPGPFVADRRAAPGGNTP